MGAEWILLWTLWFGLVLAALLMPLYRRWQERRSWKWASEYAKDHDTCVCGTFDKEGNERRCSGH